MTEHKIEVNPYLADASQKSNAVNIQINPVVRGRLVALLYEPEYMGVGYSQCLDRMIDKAYEELKEIREQF